MTSDIQFSTQFRTGWRGKVALEIQSERIGVITKWISSRPGIERTVDALKS